MTTTTTIFTATIITTTIPTMVIFPISKRNHHPVPKAPPAMSERQATRRRYIRVTTVIGAPLLPRRLLHRVRLPLVPRPPIRQPVAATRTPGGNRSYVPERPIRDVARRVLPVANRSAMTTTTATMRTKTTTKTKTIVANCPIQVPVPSPPCQPVEPHPTGVAGKLVNQNIKPLSSCAPWAFTCRQ